jgi:L-threonylcarbamoyladenylate synthase
MISKNDLLNIINALNSDSLIVYPTDTLYALGAKIFSKKAVHNVFSLKKRPLSLPLPIAVSSIEDIQEIAVFTPLAKTLAEHFLPGNLTLVLENRLIPSYITANHNTIAIRIPNDPIALALLKKTGPLTVTSANIHNQKTPSSVSEIRNMFKSKIIAEYIDDGIREGKSSTIVDVTSNIPKIIRKGAITINEIDAVVSKKHG